MTFQEARAFLYNLPRFAAEGDKAYTPGLERIAEVLEAMDNPHEKFASVHIAGTNGKGSTASFMAAICREAGYKTGLHTSPHISSVTERMRVNGEPATEDWLAEVVTRFASVFRSVGVSFFEATVALSFLYFAEQEVDYAIIETGLGGRLDATNIISPKLAIITSIGLDHTHILGSTLEEIAREKAGIIKKDVPVISGVTQPAAQTEILQAAKNNKAPFINLDDALTWEVVGHSRVGIQVNVATALSGENRSINNLDIGLGGAHQARNALLAYLGCQTLFRELPALERCVRKGLANVITLSGLRGRMEIVQMEPLVVLDVGHNSDGLSAALAAMSQVLTKKQGQLYIMFGTMRDKDVREMVNQLSDRSVHVFTPPISEEYVHPDGTRELKDNPRAFPADDLACLLEDRGVAVDPVPNIKAGLDLFYERATHKDGLLIVGSHFLVAQYLNLTFP